MGDQPRRGGIIQRRATRAGGWTKTRKQAFVGELARTCNVNATCQAVGSSSGSAYKRRAIDPEFARQWEWALQQGYVRLEGEMLERALSTAPIEEIADGVGAAIQGARPVDTELGLKLLTLRGKTDQVGRRSAVRFTKATPQQVLEALDKRLTAMEKRLGKPS